MDASPYVLIETITRSSNVVSANSNITLSFLAEIRIPKGSKYHVFLPTDAFDEQDNFTLSCTNLITSTAIDCSLPS